MTTPALGEVAGLADRPGVVGIGVDLVQIARMRTVMSRTPRFIDRVLTARERDYCLAQGAPEQHLAVRFAAKEAVIKVFGTGLFSVAMADIEVERGPQGEPSLVLSGAGRDRAEARGINGWMVSLTHTDEVAAAFVVALGPERRIGSAG